MINRDRIIKVLKTTTSDGEGGTIATYSDLGGILGQVSYGNGSRDIAEAEEYGVSVEQLVHFLSDLPLDTVNFEDIPSGVSGYTFLPNVSEEGIISWTNNGGLPNPTPRDITGPQGEQGIQGEQGVQGEQGFSPTITTEELDEYYAVTITDVNHSETINIEKGAKGEKGDPGPQGPQGIQGETGPQGPQGEQGPQGATGQTGAQGPAGQNGADGADGFSPIITETATAAGYDISITTKTGTNTISLVNGAQGATGPQGPQGETGATGAQGPAGNDGADGVSPTATITKSGTTATITITDKNGTTTATISDGATGETGPQGPTGATGATGPQGPQGPAGADGDDYVITSADYSAIAAIVYSDYMTDATNVGY